MIAELNNSTEGSEEKKGNFPKSRAKNSRDEK